MGDSMQDGGTRTARPRVLLIVGSGRSGSTLFERALGGVPGVAALGEMVHMWDRAVRDDELCACGQPFGNCPFWTAVGRRAFGGWDRVDTDAGGRGALLRRPHPSRPPAAHLQHLVSVAGAARPFRP